jgi:hypothetical protein
MPMIGAITGTRRGLAGYDAVTLSDIRGSAATHRS